MNPHKIPFLGAYNKSLNTIKRLDGKGLLYSVNYTADYYPIMNLLNTVAGGSCTTFVTPNMSGDTIMGRNFDLNHYFNNDPEKKKENMTGLIVVVRGNNPKAKYKSLGVADAFYLDSKKGTFYEGTLDDGKKDISMALFLPFICMDGVNDQGLAVSIMHLPTENRWDEREYIEYDALSDQQKKTAVLLTEPGQMPERLDCHVKQDAIAINTADKKAWVAYKKFSVNQNEKGKKTVLHPVLMRLMLDNCKDVDEAIELAKTVNVRSVTRDNDYHVLVADKSGRSVIIEWINNEMQYTDASHSANFSLCREDRYGYGQERDAIAAAAISKYKKGMPDRCIKSVLELTNQNCLDGSDVGFTQWSSIYNLNKKTMQLYIHQDYTKRYDFKL